MAGGPMRRGVTARPAAIDRAARNCHLRAMMSLRIDKRPVAAVGFRLFLLAAIVLAAFAHRPAVSKPSPYELAQYVLPDGTWPDLCATEEGGIPSHGHHDFCDFCLIAGAAAPAQPAAAVLSRPLPLLLAVIVPPMTAPPVVAVDLATASKRGPPAVSV
ncbi:MAG: hypothetical protein Kow0026_17600 [Oricola sp.]